jgi:hypothetical protein
MPLVLNSSGGGSVTLVAPSTASNVTLTAPASNATLITTSSTGQIIPKAAMPTGAVLQVVQYVYSDLSSGTNNTQSGVDNFADSGLSVTITPTSASSKILVTGSITTSANETFERVLKRLVRNSTVIFRGTPVGSRPGTIDATTRSSTYGIDNTTFEYLDSPATTSATTYKIQIASAGGGTVTWRVNHSQSDGDNNAYSPRSVSVITVMEIAA